MSGVLLSGNATICNALSCKAFPCKKILHQDGIIILGRIRTRMKERRISPQVIADECNVTYRTVVLWQTMDFVPKLIHALKVSKLLGVPIRDLAEDDDDPPMA